MPGGFPLGMGCCNALALGAVTASSIGTSVPASGTANTLGSFVTISAATPCDCAFIGISVFNNSTSGTVGTQAVNIAVGSSGNEKIIIADLIVDQSISNRTYNTWLFPVAIPAGTRISAQTQCATTSSSCDVLIYLFDGDFTQMEGCAGVDSIGFVAASTQGTTLTANATANTKATTYTTLIAATKRDYCSITAFFDSLDNTATAANFLCDIAIGPSTSEQPILPNLQFIVANPSVVAWPALFGPWPISIPAGTRISARTQCTTSSGKVGLTLYGLYQ